MELSGSNIEYAHSRIANSIHRTPVLSSAHLNQLLKAELYFKCENFQKIGAFKMRGASFFIDRLLNEDEQTKCVVTHSSGNHAQAVALAAKLNSIKAYIVMPENAPKVKVEGVRSYGGKIHFCKPTLEAREAEMEKIRQSKGAVYIPPYDHEHIILGQATAAKEMIDDYPDLDFLLAPVGGGGLLAGTALTAKYFAKEVKVIGCEPKMADDAFRSFQQKSWLPSANPNTLADGLKTSLGQINFKVILEEVQDIICCSESSMIKAMRLIWERMKIIVEPSAAVPLACMMEASERFAGKRVGIIISGGNVDLDQFYKALK